MDAFTIENYLRISLTDVILVMISTILIVLIAKKFFWSKLVAFVEKRQQLVQANIDSSLALKKEAEDLKDQYDKQIKSAGQEANVILENARAQATQEKKQILSKAQQEAVLLKQKAQEDIEREKRNAQNSMKDAIGEVAVDVAKRFVANQMDEETQKKYVDDFISEAGDKSW
ncbi:F0F1 ATP synthase subunit B [Faecalicoccus pleomorphus]|uniref:F0F1 ATP synthase subunit B n=1 Tax=Faecalicoccus pleomorphus TaxID=1323 RepID=UPI0014301437|nr:F0F1 ATP synthase subunit B [Faecalicoccus pleomorphus]MDB7986703.1 F0F1 ATP synthase subunit B [Faecalicoccus pleomorphus]MDB7990556.1 F0F1 ATP synthase subunit B [Faecalicoccus pleomorphus]MDM8292786.1 F0F1 ATP synthase subunit B [Faecalicoccus pleomorphus]NJE40800.1 ATP synthase F0 subunit B [Faecalicoccus pleomorphus]